MDKILGRTASTLSAIGHRAGRLFIFVMMVLVLVDVTARGAFRFSIVFADEYSIYLFIAAAFLGLAESFDAGGFLRVELVYDRYPRKFRPILDLIFLIIALAIIIVLSTEMTRIYMDSLVNNITSSTNRTPMWIPQILMCLGFYIFGLALIADIVKAILALPRRSGSVKEARQG